MKYITRDNLNVIIKAIYSAFSFMRHEELAEDLINNDMLETVGDYDGSLLTDGKDVLIW